MADPSNASTPSNTTAKDELALLETLRVLLQTKKARTTEDLLKYATQYGAPEAEERLRMLQAENVPVDLAFDAVSVHLRIHAHRRNSVLLAGCRGQKVGLILPLPPHLPGLFLPVASVVFLQPGEGSLQASMHDIAEQAIKGPRACRAAAQDLQALVFEAYRDQSQLYVDVASAEVLEPKMLPASIKLIAHLRPHRNPRDVQIQAGTAVTFI